MEGDNSQMLQFGYVAYWTPSTDENILIDNYGGSVLAANNEYVIPAVSGQANTLIKFPVTNIAGTYAFCFRAHSPTAGQTLGVQINSSGSPLYTGTVTVAQDPFKGWVCTPNQTVSSTQVLVWNDDTTHGGTVYLGVVLIKAP